MHALGYYYDGQRSAYFLILSRHLKLISSDTAGRRLQSQLILSLSEKGRALPADWRDLGARSALSLAHLLQLLSIDSTRNSGTFYSDAFSQD
jgi:hypothetical protein